MSSELMTDRALRLDASIALDRLTEAVVHQIKLNPELAESLRVILGVKRVPPTSDLLTVAEAAEFLRTSKQRVYDLRWEGRLRYVKDGTRLLFRRSDLEAYLAA